MSTTYSLETFARGYSLSIEQLFDRSWILYDIYKLPIYYRGQRVTLIQDGNAVPEWFEYRMGGRNNMNVRGEFKANQSEMTVNHRDVQSWFDSAVGSRDRRPTNTYKAEHLCDYGHTWFQAFLATMKQPNSLLCWHITNRNQMIEDEKNPPPAVEPEPGFFDLLKKKLFA